MIQVLKEKVVIQPGGIIEIRTSELPAGTTAEVIVIPELASHPFPSLKNKIGAAQGSFQNPEEVEKFLTKERGEWKF